MRDYLLNSSHVSPLRLERLTLWGGTLATQQTDLELDTVEMLFPTANRRAVDEVGLCVDRKTPDGDNDWEDFEGDDRIIGSPTMFMRANEGSPFTSPADSSCVCLNNLADDEACRLRTGVAGEVSSFTIEAKNSLAFPNYRGADEYAVAILDGPLAITNITVEHAFTNFYEVRYTPIAAGAYNIELYLRGVYGLGKTSLPPHVM